MSQVEGKLKVGLVLDDGLDSTDGVQQYILAIGSWLQTQGNEVHYLVGQTERRDIKNLHSLSRNVKVRFNGNRMSVPLPTSKRKLRRFLDKEQFDILHVQVPYSPFMAQRLILTAGPETAVIGSFHIAPASGLVSLATRGLGIWLRPSLKRFDRMLSVSPAAQAFAKQTFKTDSDISPNVVDYPLFHEAQPLSEYNEEKLTILFLGRLVARKGCRLLLEAIARLARESDAPEFRVVICGKGPLQAQLQDFIQKHQLGGIVSMVGFVEESDKPRYYASADIAVFPSNGGESFGIVLLEAMAGGRAAVLAGDNPGYRSVLSGRPELLFDPRDANSLALKLKQFMNDPDLKDSAKAWGEAYSAQFDITVVGHNLLAIYEEALRKRRPA